MSFLLKILVNAAALYCATRFVSGISYSGSTLTLAGVAFVFAIINTFLKPVVKFFSLPVIFLTLGLFTLIINGLMLMLTARLATALGFTFTVRGFGAAFWGALVVSIVSMILNSLITDEEKK